MGCHTVLLPEHVPPGHTSPSVVTLTPSVLCSSPQASSPLPEKKNAHEFQDILPGKRHFWALEFFLGWFPRGHLGLQLLCVEPERRKEPWACRGPWAKAQAHHGGWASHPHPGSQGNPRPTSPACAQHPDSTEAGSGAQRGTPQGRRLTLRPGPESSADPGCPSCQARTCTDVVMSCGEAGGLVGSTQLDAPWKFPWSRDGNHFLSTWKEQVPPSGLPFHFFPGNSSNKICTCA